MSISTESSSTVITPVSPPQVSWSPYWIPGLLGPRKQTQLATINCTRPMASWPRSWHQRHVGHALPSFEKLTFQDSKLNELRANFDCIAEIVALKVAIYKWMLKNKVFRRIFWWQVPQPVRRHLLANNASWITSVPCRPAVEKAWWFGSWGFVTLFSCI